MRGRRCCDNTQATRSCATRPRSHLCDCECSSLLSPVTSDHSSQILGTGVNSSGSLVPANAPSAVAQRQAMQRAFRMAGRTPQEVDFIELHATGASRVMSGAFYCSIPLSFCQEPLKETPQKQTGSERNSSATTNSLSEVLREISGTYISHTFVHSCSFSPDIPK